MIYRQPSSDDAIDQGDIVDECPVFYVSQFDIANLFAPEVGCAPSRVVVLTQACDLANQKTDFALCAVAHDAQKLISDGVLKIADVRGPIRAGRVLAGTFSERCEPRNP